MTAKPEIPDLDSLMFPGRTKLTLQEVAAKLKVCEQHIKDLIREGKLRCEGSQRAPRIPVGAYEEFLRSRSSLLLKKRRSRSGGRRRPKLRC